MFCSKCGSLIIPGKDKNICPVCGNEEKGKKKGDGKTVAKSTEKDIVMIRNQVHIEPLDSEAVCPKCNHKGAYYILKQTRAADEPETAIYTCAECGHRWREY
jgi:DNA-directed RNA polymerase subunit M